ncbi:hypothetical protein J7M23_05555, partial [Candidatus Sumerlaeota bacterium]|nr:hypothetical protein [Candidatus Sumerlaeota bacterium]
MKRIYGVVLVLNLAVALVWAQGIRVETGVLQGGDQTTINFSGTFNAPPAVIVNSQDSGVPYITATVNNSTSGATVRLIDHNGTRPTTSWIQWIAIGQGTENLSSYSVWTEVALHSDDDNITISPAFSSVPTIVTCAQKLGVPYISCSMDNATDNFDIAIIDHNGTSGSNVWLQSIAMASGSWDDNLRVEYGVE